MLNAQSPQATDWSVVTERIAAALKLAEEEFSDLARDLMNWLYRVLESEYNYLLSDDVVDETIAQGEML